VNPHCPVIPMFAGAFGQGRLIRGCLGGRAAGVVECLGGLFCRFGRLESDRVAQRFELALQAASAVLDGVALALPVGSEVSILACSPVMC